MNDDRRVRCVSDKSVGGAWRTLLTRLHELVLSGELQLRMPGVVGLRQHKAQGVMVSRLEPRTWALWFARVQEVPHA